MTRWTARVMSGQTKKRPKPAPLGALASLAAALALLPGPALAHGSGQGLGAFWNGMVHALDEPAQLLALLALGLWLAIGKPSRSQERRAALAAGLGFVLAAGGAMASGQAVALADSGLPTQLLQALGLALALATAAHWWPTHAALAPLVPAACALCLVGTALGSPAGALSGIDAFGWLAGVALGNALLVVYTALGVQWLVGRWPAATLVPRVLASWLAASLLLVAVLPLVPVVPVGKPGEAGRPAPSSAPLSVPYSAPLPASSRTNSPSMVVVTWVQLRSTAKGRATNDSIGATAVD